MSKEDPWTLIPNQKVDIDGIEVEVSGLTVGEITAISKQYKSDPEAMTIAMICQCCTRDDGKPITREYLLRCRQSIFTRLNEAVFKVNGFVAGNLGATGGDDSSSA